MSTESTPPIELILLPGQVLKSAREEKGLTIAEMAAISNLTKQVIIGIEENNYDNLHGLSFVRGYLKLYAKKLGVDEAQVLEPFDVWKSQAGEPQPAKAFSGFQEEGAQSSNGPKAPNYAVYGAIIVLVLGFIGVSISIDDQSNRGAEQSAVIQPQAIQESSRESGSSAITSEPRSASEFGSKDGIERSTVLSKSVQITEKYKDGENQANSIQRQNESAGPSQSTEEPEQRISEQELTTNDTNKVGDQISPAVQEKQEQSPAESQPAVKKQELATSATQERRVTRSVQRQASRPERERSEATLPTRARSQSIQTTVTSTPPVAQSNTSTQNTQIMPAGRVIAEASGLQPAPIQSVETTQVSPSDDMGARVISQTVTGPDAATLAMGARGDLQMEFKGESWVEVRDARGRLVLADLMRANQIIRLDTYGPVEVLVGAVSLSVIRFNGKVQDLAPKAVQDVARVTLGSD